MPEPPLESPEGEFVPEAGWVEPPLAGEFPGLALRYTALEASSGRSPPAIKERLRVLSDRLHGARAVNLRQEPIPSAYRVFFRQIGLDPDQQRTPVEQVILERIQRGRFRSVSQLDDALTIAIVETGVAVRAFDADRVEGRLGLRLAQPGEALEGSPGEIPAGSLLIADERRPLAFLFGATAAGRGVTPKTARITLVAIQVDGVPDISVEEAVWLAATVLRSA